MSILSGRQIVWVLIPDFPPWPARVLDDLPPGFEAFPENSDAAVQYFGTNEIGFVALGEPERVRTFDKGSSDGDLRFACQDGDAGVVAALNAADRFFDSGDLE